MSDNIKSIKDITNQISSKDIAVLDLCNNFLDTQAEKERLRGEAHIHRANLVITVIAAVSAFLVFMISTFINDIKDSAPAAIAYSAMVLWLFRAIWYAVKSMRTQSRKMVGVDSIFEFQNMSEIDTKKEIIIGKFWELQHSIQPNTERLFYVQRAQRALIISITLPLLCTLFILADNTFNFVGGTSLIAPVSILLVIFFLFGDWVIEKSGIWEHK